MYQGYLWSNGTAGGNNTITDLCAGTYTVTVTDSRACTGTASATVVLDPNSVCSCGVVVENISPNPFSDNVALTLRLNNTGNCNPNTLQSTKVMLYNAMGVKVATVFEDKLSMGVSHTLNFNGGNLPPGLYYVRVNACSTNVINPVYKN